MEFRTIACVVSLAEQGREAALRGALLARQLNAHLTLVAAIGAPDLARGFGPAEAYFPPITEPAEHRERERAMKSSLDSLAGELSERHGIRVSTRLIEGLDGGALLDGHGDFDLIVVTGEHSSALARLLHLDNSAARTLSRRAPCPVVVCSGPPQVAMIKHALVGIDYSQASAMALEVASSLVGTDGVLSMVHVQRDEVLLPPSSGPSNAWSSTSPQQRSPSQRQVDSAYRLQTFVAARRPNVSQVEHYLEVGKPAPVIMEVAGRIGAHAIFVGSHVPEGLGERILGTVADQLIGSADLPVFAVPSTSDEAAYEPAEGVTDRLRDRVDSTLEQTFPASDPPSGWVGKPGTV